MVPVSIMSPARWQRVFRCALLLAVLVPLLASCALMVNGTTQTVPVQSTPEGAEVFVDGELRGVTPMELVLRRGETVSVIVRLGGEQRDVVLTSRVDGGLVAVAAAPGVLAGAATIGACGRSAHGSPDMWSSISRGLACQAGILATLAALAPLAIDAGTGAWYHYDMAEIVVSFR
jgi:hypothetical protein